MRLVMTLLVRDEEDILADNIEFHRAKGVDFFVVTDNLSTDRTPEILEDYARRGLVAWWRETSDDYSQHRWVTRMAREAATSHGADWVINNDADEFWWPPAGGLKDVLARVPRKLGGLYVPRFDFVPRPDASGPFWQRLTVRYTESVKADGTPLLRKVVHRAHPEVEITQGNHDASAPGLRPLARDERIEILHFPNRSYPQLENKVVKGGQAYARNTEFGPGVGRRWRVLYERYLEGTLPHWWDEQTFDDAAIAKGLADGTLVRDHRLHDFFAAPEDRLGADPGVGPEGRTDADPKGRLDAGPKGRLGPLRRWLTRRGSS